MNEQDQKINKITDSLNREKLESLPVAMDRRGLQYSSYDQLMEASKTMATAKSIPPHLRGSPGDCLMIREMAMEHGLSPYGLAIHSYLINGILSHDAQAVNAMILKSAPTIERPRYTFEGEGDELRCSVVATFIGEATPCEYRSPPIGQISPKNSPLWKTDPEQQLCYFSIRRWARRYCPDIILGINSKDELEDNPHIGADRAKDVSPKLIERLPGRMEGAGFSDQDIDEVAGGEAASRKRRKPAAARKAASGDSPPGGTLTRVEAENPPTVHASPGKPIISENVGELFGEELPTYEIYRANLVKWLDSLPPATSATDIIQWYDSERPLRRGLTAEQTKKLDELVARKFEQRP